MYHLYFVTYVTVKFKRFRRRCILKKIHNITFDLGSRNAAQYPENHDIYEPAKFEVATSNNLGGGAFIYETLSLFDLMV